MNAAFAAAKQALLAAIHLVHPVEGATLSLVVDASTYMPQYLCGKQVGSLSGFSPRSWRWLYSSIIKGKQGFLLATIPNI
jgi:hypothetical protein